eukprot:gene12552-biopygen10005
MTIRYPRTPPSPPLISAPSTIITIRSMEQTEQTEQTQRLFPGELTPCTVCMGEIPDPEMKRCPSCGGIFHTPCIFRWLETTMRPTCPNCRAELDLDDLGAVEVVTPITTEGVLGREVIFSPEIFIANAPSGDELEGLSPGRRWALWREVIRLAHVEIIDP